MGAEDLKDAKPHETAQLLGGTAIKPKGWDRTGLEAVKYLIWNPDTGEILTRTPLSWLKITTFYIIYYSCLAGFWAAAMAIFWQTLPNPWEGPKWTQNSSIIGTNPGLGAKPPNSDKLIDSSIYKFSLKDTALECPPGRTWKEGGPCGEGDTTADWITRMNKFLDNKDKIGTVRGYEEDGTEIKDEIKDLKDCDNDDEIKNDPRVGVPNCKYDMEPIKTACGKYFGYRSSDGTANISPCIFLKFNTIWGWPQLPQKPVRIDINALKDPKHDDYEQYLEMTPALKKKIEAIYEEKDEDKLNYIWVDCHGRYPADKEVLENNIEYIASGDENQGISLKYFPYQGTAYGVPIVAVKFKELPVGQLVHVECRAWFHGVRHSSRDKEGLTQFELLVTA